MLPLTRGLYAIVNERFYDFLMHWDWHACWSEDSQCWYAQTKHRVNGKVREISVHHIIFSAMPHIMYDHKNQIPRDNRIENLRPSDKSTNGYNRGLSSANTSGHKGVSRRESLGKWAAYITVNKDRIHLGFFVEKEDAARAYDRAAIKYHGEFAFTNFPREDYL